MTVKRKLCGVVCAACLMVATAPAAANENVFKTALRYTVQVRVTLPVPFNGDRKGSGLGAGFVVDSARGWIMTNAHVVGRSPSRVEVAFHGRDFQEAAKVYVDPFLDVAIVGITNADATRDVAAPTLHCGGMPPVGHPVGAFGHPWRLPFTGTRGIISGVTARYRTELLQTDAPINQGNSGGPLISLETGRVVGINTAGIRGAQNTNFAVAMKYACRVLELLRQGTDPSPPDLKLVYFKDVDDRRELRVARSYAGAAEPQLRPGDLIRGVDGVDGTIENETQLLHALRGRLDDTNLQIVRGGEDTSVAGASSPMPRVLEARGVYVSGILFAPVTLRDGDEAGLRGLMVHFVESGSVGEAREIERADLLEAIDGAPALDVDALYARLLDAKRFGRRVLLTFKKLSGGDSVFSYTRRRLPVSELKMIGPPATAVSGTALPNQAN